MTSEELHSCTHVFTGATTHGSGYLLLPTYRFSISWGRTLRFWWDYSKANNFDSELALSFGNFSFTIMRNIMFTRLSTEEGHAKLTANSFYGQYITYMRSDHLLCARNLYTNINLFVYKTYQRE